MRKLLAAAVATVTVGATSTAHAELSSDEKIALWFEAPTAIFVAADVLAPLADRTPDALYGGSEMVLGGLYATVNVTWLVGADDRDPVTALRITTAVDVALMVHGVYCIAHSRGEDDPGAVTRSMRRTRLMPTVIAAGPRTAAGLLVGGTF
jgi:hypothetical protein